MGMDPAALTSFLVGTGLITAENQQALPAIAAALQTHEGQALANVMLGGGAVTDYAQTQPGHSIDAQTARMESANELTGLRETADAEMARLLAGHDHETRMATVNHRNTMAQKAAGLGDNPSTKFVSSAVTKQISEAISNQQSSRGAV